MKFYDPRTAPNVYDIVWCRWPRREDKLGPGPWARPVLVLDVRIMLDERNQMTWAAVTAAYGTGLEHIEPADVLGSLIITPSECADLGLHKATIFKLDHRNRKRLPWAADYFISQGYILSQNLIAGSLNEEQCRRFHACFERCGYVFPLP